MAKKSKNTPAMIKEPVQQIVTKPKNQLLRYFFIFTFGFLAGITFTIIKTDDSMKRASSQAADQGHIHDEEVSQALINLEAEVTADPDNYQAWIRLGHLYFDTDQPEKAIEAYNRSLELHIGSADLLTDLGVMYRRVGQAEKAVEIFDLAIEKDPSHLPSRFNKGIVLFYDLNDSQGAINSWEALLKIDPEAKAGNGRSVRDFVDSLKNQQNSTE